MWSILFQLLFAWYRTSEYDSYIIVIWLILFQLLFACRYRTSEDRFPIIVSQDCGHGPTADVVKSYGSKVTHLQVENTLICHLQVRHTLINYGTISLMIYLIWFIYIFIVHFPSQKHFGICTYTLQFLHIYNVCTTGM